MKSKNTTVALIVILIILIVVAIVHSHYTLPTAPTADTGTDVTSTTTDTATGKQAPDTVVISMGDSNKTIPVKLGRRLEVNLGEQNWKLSWSDPSIVKAVSGVPSMGQGLYDAVKTGTTTLTGEGRPICKTGEMCAQYIVSFTATVVVAQ